MSGWKKRLGWVLGILLFLAPGWAWSEEAPQVLALLSAEFPPYQEAAEGFEASCGCEVRRVSLAAAGPRYPLEAEVEATRPALVLAVGPRALEAASQLTDVPVVYVMVVSPDPAALSLRNVTGVRMAISPEEQLGRFLRAVPGLRRIGLIYDPARSAEFVRRAREAAGKAGVSLVTAETGSAREVPARLAALRGRIDAFWMIPDTTVVTPQTAEAILLLTAADRVPVLTFSERYVKLGALMSMSVGVSAGDMGRQAGRIGMDILRRGRVVENGYAYAEQGRLSVNYAVAGRMGLDLTP